MRARELLSEDYNQSLESDLNNILVGAKGSGLTQVDTKDVVKQLYGMGYSVNVNSIIVLLSRNPMVINASPEVITLDDPEVTSAEGNTKDSADQVADMAQKATKIG